MSYKTALKVYEIVSYVLILGATVVFFMLRNETAGLTMTLLILVLAVFCRMMMERTRYKACEEENEQLSEDLRRLTKLLADEKKKNQEK